MASETINGLRIRVSIEGQVTGSDGTRQVVSINEEYNFSDGTGSSQIGAIFQDLARPLNVTSEVLDLDALADFKGATMTDNNAVKFIYAKNKSTTTGENLKMGGDDFAAAGGPLVDTTDKVVVGPSGMILMINNIDGWGITAATKDGLKFEHTGNSTYDLLLGFDNT